MRVDYLARELIAQHGTRAVYAAVERINESIDRGDRAARNFWAEVVHAIHEQERAIDQTRNELSEPCGKETGCTDDIASG